ncbi:MAG: hypothetical protein ACXVCP_13420 [Bdellovibrio sp.]
MALKLAFSIDNKCTTIMMSGSLNEYSSALDGVDVNPEFDVHIDLKELHSINSLGVRNFHSFIHRIHCEKLKFFYCPRPFVNQLNLLNSFLPEKAEIESFFVPYYSEMTGEEGSALFTKYLEYKKSEGMLSLKIPELFDSQGNKMELDIMRDHYFRFLYNYY